MFCLIGPMSTLKKNLDRCYPKKSQIAPYKNLNRFYRAPFKSLLMVQIILVIEVATLKWISTYYVNSTVYSSTHFECFHVQFLLLDMTWHSTLHNNLTMKSFLNSHCCTQLFFKEIKLNQNECFTSIS